MCVTRRPWNVCAVSKPSARLCLRKGTPSVLLEHSLCLSLLPLFFKHALSFFYFPLFRNINFTNKTLWPNLLHCYSFEGYLTVFIFCTSPLWSHEVWVEERWEKGRRRTSRPHLRLLDSPDPTRAASVGVAAASVSGKKRQFCIIKLWFLSESNITCKK